MSFLEEGLRIYREEGLETLFRKSSDQIQSKLSELPRSIEYSLRNAYWSINGGTHELSISGIDAEFDAAPEAGGDIIRWTYDIEKDWMQDLLDNVREDDVVFDVGANIGFYSCFLTQKLKDGKVIAFEPFQPNYRQLRRNLEHNSGNFDVYEVALSDEEGTRQFTEPTDGEIGFPTGTLDGHEPSPNKTTVRTTTGDKLVSNGVAQPNVVKVDVEGSEPLVLDGMEHTLRNDQCRQLYLEIHLPKNDRPSVVDFGSSAEELKDFVGELGFEIKSTDRRNQEIHVIAEK